MSYNSVGFKRFANFDLVGSSTLLGAKVEISNFLKRVDITRPCIEVYIRCIWVGFVIRIL